MFQKSQRFHLVLCLIILSNIINMIFPKGMGYEEQTGFAYQISKYTYGLCIVIMLPTMLDSKRRYFEKMRLMALYIMIHMLAAMALGLKYDIGSYLKTIMICLSFIFFEETLAAPNVNRKFIYAYLLSVFVNIAYLTLTQNRLEQAVENEGHVGGGQGIATAMVYLVPLLFYLFRGRAATYLYLVGLLAVLVSLRRTAILAYLFCLPFVYQRMKGTLSRRSIYIMVAGLAAMAAYIYTNYWFVIEDRFADMTEANDSGYYGSGRTGWWMVLINNFLSSPLHWLQGFGLGQVALHMAKAGFPYGNAHNDYLEVGYTYGLIGLYLWFGSIWKLYKLSNRNSLNEEGSIIKMASLSYLLIALMSGATLQPHFMCVALFAALMINKKMIKAKEI